MMPTERKARLYAVVGTIAIAIAVIALLLCSHISLRRMPDITEQHAPITLEEEFVEVLDVRPISPKMADDTPARAKAEEKLPSQPTPPSGTDVEDEGPAGDAPKVVTSKQESTVKVKEKEPKKTGPSAEEIKKKKEEEAIKRKANNEVTDAFSKAKGKHNNATSTTDKGNNGSADGNAPSGTLTGRGAGTAGGGWAIPAYAPVPSTMTGSVKMTVTIDREGRVTKLTFTGGDAPAATNAAVRNACAAEVRSRRFTRSNPDTAPETSTAYITYTFR